MTAKGKSSVDGSQGFSFLQFEISIGDEGLITIARDFNEK
jgi:hypothetical protein